MVGVFWFLAVVLTLQGRYLASSSLSAERGVPIGQPVLGDYGGTLRPRVHFSPPRGFMNDPNGMFIDVEGVYHLYYQYNPIDTRSGFQHWGHATSRDLYHWTNQPIALFPGNASEGIFSGSAVIDAENTSGFFADGQSNGVVVIYTIATPFMQSQGLAYSSDNGYTFTKYAGNPVLAVEFGSQDFRDPLVHWHAPSHKWVMVVSWTQEFTIGIFTSPNLRDWTHASNFSRQGILGSQWECPNLVEMPMEGGSVEQTLHVLYVSLNPGAPQGGSIGQYFPGHFNGTHFVAVDAVARIADFGKDNYAAQFFSGIPATRPQINIAWASNWQYCNHVPTGPREGWQSAMSLPRLSYLKNVTKAGYDLMSMPVDSMQTVLPVHPIASEENLGANGEMVVRFGPRHATSKAGTGSGSIVLDVVISGLDRRQLLSEAASLNFSLTASSSAESLVGGQFFTGDGGFFIDRSGTHGMAHHPFFTHQFSSTRGLNVPTTSAWHMRLVVDRSVCEVFLGPEGEKSATLSFFPDTELDSLTVATNDLNAQAQVKVVVWELLDAWADGGDGLGDNTRAMAGGWRKVD